ncbi:MAG: helix-turn-helix domain-containing protein [Steroidobacteraceae bacterium]
MEPRIIKTDEQYRHFRGKVEKLAILDPEPESTQGIRLELLAKLVEDYEKIRFAFAKPDPIDAIIFRMEQQGLRQKDVAALLGGKNRASEVLARKRSLTIPMIRALYERLDIPLDLLIREPGATYSTSESVTRSAGGGRYPRAPIHASTGYRGFEGFVPLAFVSSRLRDIPAKPGVYIVLCSGKSTPQFRRKSPAGWFKGLDPSYSLDELRRKWVSRAEVIYIGKAGPGPKRTLRKRISELVRFGSGAEVGHRGGRAIWQLEGVWSARVAWKATRDDPRAAEKSLLADFHRRFARLPFANFAK